MIDEKTGKPMQKVYTVYWKEECEDEPRCDFCETEYCRHQANCRVTFCESFTDDDQHFLHLEYSFNTLFENNAELIYWEEFGKMISECDLNRNLLNTIRKLVDGNWMVKLSDNIYFRCHHEIELCDGDYYSRNSKNMIDLGLIAECYDDCEECDKCHNHDWRYDSQYEKCRDCAGCHEHPCTRVNGRKKLMELI